MLYRLKRDIGRRGKRANWYVSVMRKGKRVQFCTRTCNRDEAAAIEGLVLKGLAGLEVDSVCEMVRAVLGAGPVIDPRYERYRMIESLPKTIEELLEREQSGIDEKSIRRRVSILRVFAAWALQRGIIKVTDLTVNTAWLYVDTLPPTAKTRQNIVGQLSVSWNMLRRAGYADDNPWTNVRPRSKPSEARSGTAFTHEEVSRLIDESRRVVWTSPTGCVDALARSEPRDTWLTSAIMIAVYTGLRQSDVFRLKWEDFDGANFTVTPSKTKRFGRVVHVPVHPSLRDYLCSLERVSDTILPESPTHPERAWNLCIKRAGIQRGANEMTTFHSLRHTFATWVRDAGGDKGDQMLLGGWTNIKTANRYDHAAERLTALVGRLPCV